MELIRLAEGAQGKGKRTTGWESQTELSIMVNYEQDLEINWGIDLKKKRCKAIPGRWKSKRSWR